MPSFSRIPSSTYGTCNPSNIPEVVLCLADDRWIIEIHGLTPIESKDLQNGPIKRILQQIKNLYGEGDRFGTPGRRWRRQRKLPSENPGLLIHFSHATTQRQDGVVTIEILYNWAAPAASWVDEKHRPIRELTVDEIRSTMTGIANLCCIELQQHFQDIAREAAATGATPIFYQGHPPAFYGTLMTVPTSAGSMG